MLTLCMTWPSEGYLDALSRNITYSLQDYRQLGHRTFQALTTIWRINHVHVIILWNSSSQSFRSVSSVNKEKSNCQHFCSNTMICTTGYTVVAENDDQKCIVL